jgi:hypothetical protein
MIYWGIFFLTLATLAAMLIYEIFIKDGGPGGPGPTAHT